MLAVSHGKAETARLLLAAGADMNIQDEDGSTALMCAAEHGHKHIVRWMLTLADIDATLQDNVRVP
jgi:ankyrin repeat protein